MNQGYYNNIGSLIPSIGAMDMLITIQYPETTRSATGAEVVTWTDYRTVWAKVDYPQTTSRESMMGDQELEVRRAMFSIRYTGAVRAKWRLVFDSEIYDIVKVTPLGRDKFEQILAEVRQ